MNLKIILCLLGTLISQINAVDFIIESKTHIDGATVLAEHNGIIISKIDSTYAEVYYEKSVNENIIDVHEDVMIEDPMMDVVADEIPIRPDTTQKLLDPSIWGLDTIDDKQDLTYDYSYTGINTVSYIIDSGIKPHGEFEDRLMSGKSFISDPSTVDCMMHGTFVASQVGGKTYGVAKKTKLVPIRVFSCSGGTPSSVAVSAIYWIIKNKPAGEKCLVNMSFGSPFSDITNKAVRDLVNAGCVVSVSAGNSADNADNYSPASEHSVLTVGAIDSSMRVAYYSNEGSSVDLFAPGSNVLGLSLSGSPTILSGTSMASPYVLGTCAQIWEKYPGHTNLQVMSEAVSIAKPGVLSGFKIGSSPNLSLRIPKGSVSPVPSPTQGPTLRKPCKSYGRKNCVTHPRCRWLFNKKYCTER